MPLLCWPPLQLNLPVDSRNVTETQDADFCEFANLFEKILRHLTDIHCQELMKSMGMDCS
jgi:hypothetical protein